MVDQDANARASVLIADDEPSLRRLVAATIQSDEYAVLEAEDGAVAWELLQHHRPTVALLDVRMPGLDGVELTRRIRAEPALAGMRVILLTAEAAPKARELGLAAGADYYLTKPFSPLELIRAIEAALG